MAWPSVSREGSKQILPRCREWDLQYYTWSGPHAIRPPSLVTSLLLQSLAFLEVQVLIQLKFAKIKSKGTASFEFQIKLKSLNVFHEIFANPVSLFTKYTILASVLLLPEFCTVTSISQEWGLWGGIILLQGEKYANSVPEWSSIGNSLESSSHNIFYDLTSFGVKKP